MKLKVLPKSQRKHNHYLVLDVKSEEELSKNEFTSIVWDACVRFQGENNTSNFNLWTIELIEKEETFFIFLEIKISIAPIISSKTFIIISPFNLHNYIDRHSSSTPQRTL